MNPTPADPRSKTIDVLVALLLLVPILLLGGWTLSVIWNWYAPLVSAALPALTYKQAFAARVIVSFLGPKPDTRVNSPANSPTGILVSRCLTELGTVGLLGLIWLIIR